MRRLYSEQELTKIIGEVFDAKLEAGAFDTSIAEAVDAYLVENPVDITALEGQTIAPAIVNATGSISAPSIIETMNGYSFTAQTGWTGVYVGVVKNGNKITFAIFGNMSFDESVPSSIRLGDFVIPSAIGSNLYPYIVSGSDVLSQKNFELFENTNTNQIGLPVAFLTTKTSNTGVRVYVILETQASLTTGKTYNFRYEVTFLLSENLIG